jgi:ABC-type spermidine/putrescine transport system permease subunit I
VVIGLVNIFVPFMVLPIMASIERISPSLEEAAQNLGASGEHVARGPKRRRSSSRPQA